MGEETLKAVPVDPVLKETAGGYLIEGMKNLYHDIIEVDIQREEAIVWHSSKNPALECCKVNYSKLLRWYRDHIIYEESMSEFVNILSAESMKKFIGSSQGQSSFDTRYRVPGREVFHWYRIQCLKSAEGKFFILAENINEIKKQQIIDRAACTDYDFVLCLNVKRHTYYVYTNPRLEDKNTSMVGLSYEADSHKFLETIMGKEQAEEMKRQANLAYVIHQLQKEDKYTVHKNLVLADGRKKDKKFTFQYLDDRKDQILLVCSGEANPCCSNRKSEPESKAELYGAENGKKEGTEFLEDMVQKLHLWVTAVIGQTAKAGTHIQNTERMIESLDKINRYSRQILSLVNEVLEITELEKKGEGTQENFELGQQFSSVFAMGAVRARIKQQELTADMHTILHGHVIGNPEYLQTAFLHIIKNAVNHTQEKGKIRLRLLEKPSTRKGYGNYIFEAEDSGNVMQQNLAIAARIVKLMQGELKVQGAPDKGNRISITFCLKLQNEKERRPQIYKKRKVLIIGKQETFLQETGELFRQLGGKCTCIEKNEELTKRLKEENQTVVDDVIVQASAFDQQELLLLLGHIRKEAGKKPYVVLVTALEQMEHAFEWKAAGADECIDIPIYPSKLAAMQKNIQVQRREKELRIQMDWMKNMNLRRKRILVADGNEINRAILTQALLLTGADIIQACSGEELLALYESYEAFHFDMIFIDIWLPVAGGYAVIRKIRSSRREDAKSIPVFAMTADAMEAEALKSVEAGMNEYVVKPFDFKTIAGSIKKFF